jgi:hypothetical protein
MYYLKFMKNKTVVIEKAWFHSSKRRPTKRAATVLKVKSKTTIKGKTSPSQASNVA